MRIIVEGTVTSITKVKLVTTNNMNLDKITIVINVPNLSKCDSYLVEGYKLTTSSNKVTYSGDLSHLGFSKCIDKIHSGSKISMKVLSMDPWELKYIDSHK